MDGRRAGRIPRLTRSSLVAASLLLIAGSPSARAESARPASPRSPGAGGLEPREPQLSGYRKAGPLFYQAFLRVRGAGYDDNVFLDRDEPRADFTATLGPELRGVVRLGRRAWVGLHGTTDFNAYARHGSLNHFDNERDAEVSAWLGDVRLRAAVSGGRFLRRPSSEVDDRVASDVSGLRADARWEATEATVLEAKVDWHEERYETVGDVDYDRLLGRTEKLAAVSARHRVAPLTWAVVDLAAVLVEAAPGGARVGVRDLSRGRVETGLDFAPGALLEGSVRLGAARVEGEDPPGVAPQRYRGPSGRAAVAARLGSRARAGLTFRRDFTASTYLDNVFFRNDAAGAWWLHAFTSRVAGEVGFESGWQTYPAGGGARRRDRTREPYAGARVRLGRGTVLSVRLVRWTRDSSVPGEDRERLVIEQSLVVPL